MAKIISICKDGKRYDMALNKGPIAAENEDITVGAIVSMNSHTGKVLEVEGDLATVSWEDASLSEVQIGDLKYEGRVSKGGPGSGRKPGGGSKFGGGRKFESGGKGSAAAGTVKRPKGAGSSIGKPTLDFKTLPKPKGTGPKSIMTARRFREFKNRRMS